MALQDVEITTVAGAITQASCGCGCCGGGSSAEQPSQVGAGADRATTEYAVAGMTCGHCVGAVTRELADVDGVVGVDVTLRAGGTSTVTVTSSGELSDEAVVAAIEEAGYTVVPA